MALACTCLGYGYANAETVDLGEIELGTPYYIQAFSSVTGTITAPSTGILYQYGGDSFVYTAEDGTQVTPQTAGQCEEGQLWAINVEEGVVYTLYNSFLMNPGNNGYIIWNMQGAQAFSLKSIDPEEGSSFNDHVNGTGDILVTMSEPWSYTRAYIECNGVTSDYSYSTSSLSTQGIRIGDWMAAFYADGTFASDDITPFVLHIQGISNAGGDLYNGDGILDINYNASPKSIDIVETNVATGNDFLSYYEPGDPNGVFYFTFSGDLSTTIAPELSIGAGNVEEEGNYYFERLYGVVDGNTVSFDLTGVNRAAAIARCNVTEGAMVSVKLSNVFDSNGVVAEGAGAGSVGSYSYTLYYKIVKEQVLDVDFNPASGSFLTNTSTINLWINNASCIIGYDGILFQYANDSELIAAADLENIATSDNELEFNIPVPERAKTEPVTVSLSGIVSNDGYAKTVKATYNQLVVLWSTPFAEDKDCSVLPAGEQIRVRTNLKAADYPEIDALSLTITNLANNEQVYSAEMNREEGQDAYFVCAGPAEDIYFNQDCQYEAAFASDDAALGTYAFTFYGATVNSIAGIVAEGANGYDVYRLNGIVVVLGADKEALSSLAPGIYVINGTKVLLR